MKQERRFPAGHKQQGAATLVVVMVLFFIVSLVAAYTNRNLIFEQRTSANQYRSTQALEAAEAGVEWALALLNHGLITSTCLPSTSAGDSSFRQRYLDVNLSTGNLTAKPRGATTEPRSQSCVLNGDEWSCSCPEDAAPSPVAPGGVGNPAFLVRFENLTPASQPGVIRLHAVGCTRLDAGCLSFDPANPGVMNEGRAAITVLVALTGNAVSLPKAAVLARERIDFSAAAPAVYNTNPSGTGVTLHAGGPIDIDPENLHSTPGTPGSQSMVEDDPALSGLTAVAPFSVADRMFAAVFNMTPATFNKQPAVVELTCGGACTADDVRSAISLNPDRPIWVPGPLVVNAGTDIGEPSKPVLLIVDGDLSFSSNVPIYGLVYIRTSNWVTAGTDGRVQGAVVAEGRISGSGAQSFVYDGDVLTALRFGTGSFVRVPGSWKDYR